MGDKEEIYDSSSEDEDQEDDQNMNWADEDVDQISSSGDPSQNIKNILKIK